MSLLLDTFLESRIFLSSITFAFGVILTVAITSVNHKRIHRDDIRKTIFDAVLNTKICASEHWLSEYKKKNSSELEGSYHFLTSIMPLSYDMMNTDQILEIEKLLQDLFSDLMDVEEMTKERHQVDLNRVIQIHKSSGLFLKQYYSIYLNQTRMRSLTIYPCRVQNLWIWLKSPDKNPQFKNGGA